MNYNYKLKINIETDSVILSSKYEIFKTQDFINITKNLIGVDYFLSKIAEGIIKNSRSIVDGLTNLSDTIFKVEDSRREHTFYVRLIQEEYLTKIVFVEYRGKDKEIRRNDRRFLHYTKLYSSFEVIIYVGEKRLDIKEFSKLYSLTNNDEVNFPFLSKEQKAIVEKEDENVLIQGVAGSGKTNICINKIVYSASRNYLGKVLYTTFSRGLLLDTQSKINIFVSNIKAFLAQYDSGKVVFMDNDYKLALENKLGVYLNSNDSKEHLIEKLKEIILFLETKVEYRLLEDFYTLYIDNNAKFGGEYYFSHNYVTDIKNHQLKGKLSRLNNLSIEVVYKEIYGMIMGCHNENDSIKIMSLDEYVDKRKDSFNKSDCEIIYSLATDYYNHLKANNIIDTNIISRELLLIAEELPKYSLAIIDEVQDLTEINLYLIKQLTVKIFAVGDALQMINPSFFSFSFLKRLMFTKDIVTVKELAHNYRNSKKIVEIIDELSKINTKYFGTHSFVIKGKCVDESHKTQAIYVKDKDFLSRVAKDNFDGISIIVSNLEQKNQLRKVLKRQEILTVSEVKGLERDTVIMYNVLSSNSDKWNALDRNIINRKIADENSVYRYYFNLFYVGATRAKNNLYVVEEKRLDSFAKFFDSVFDNLSSSNAISCLEQVASKIAVEQDDLVARISEFVKLEQYDNARFTLSKIMDNDVKYFEETRIDISEQYIRHGQLRDAGIAYWQKGFVDEAKKMFELSGDKSLIDLVEASTQNSQISLNIDIVEFYPKVMGSPQAKDLILKAIADDLSNLKKNQQEIKQKLKRKSS